MPQQQTELLNFLQAYYHQTSEMIIFIDAQGQVIDMNEAAKRVISSDNDMSGISTTICGRCEAVYERTRLTHMSKLFFAVF